MEKSEVVDLYQEDHINRLGYANPIKALDLYLGRLHKQVLLSLTSQPRRTQERKFSPFSVASNCQDTSVTCTGHVSQNRLDTFIHIQDTGVSHRESIF